MPHAGNAMPLGPPHCLEGTPRGTHGALSLRSSGRTPLTALVDRKVLVRHLTGDPPDLAESATAYLGAAGELFLTDLVGAETVYVLESYYGALREEVGEAVRSLVAFDSIV